MKRNHNRHILTALALGLLLGAPLAIAQTSENTPSKGMQQMGHEMMHEQKAQGQKMEGDMPAKCKAMMEKKKEMMAKCKMMDAKLDELAAAMNTATGQQKIDAMAALLNELVQQRKNMHTMMMQMQKGMMSGMMGGMSKDAKSKCTMMQKKMQQHEAGASEK
ncbi:MAG: hypothetical protein GXP47_03845 [Acidobacteria bacterium]|nr:hypothetical protein [Acidobacteriota bacterium]